MDYDWSNTQRLWGRYTHDLSETRELGGLFFGTAIPGVAGTDTTIPGQVAAFGLRSIIGSNKLNELNYHFSSNNITTLPAEGVKNTKAAFGVTIPEVFPENNAGLIPVIDVTGLSTARRQPVVPHPVHQSLDHGQFLVAARQARLQDWRPGDLRAEERERRQPQPGRLRVRRDDRRRHGVPELPARQRERRPAPAAATPRPSATSIMNLRFNRFEFYAQDTWRPTCAPDGRLRPALLAVSADHRPEQPAGDVRSVDV